jgi:uncharacterized membrane protein YedE/YeeE
MRVTLSRGRYWFVFVLLFLIGFVLYTRLNPHWHEPLVQVAKDYYLLPENY